MGAVRITYPMLSRELICEDEKDKDSALSSLSSAAKLPFIKISGAWFLQDPVLSFVQ